ncbi:hypothetical protein [Georgenia thermotolerans]|uniref:Uncharacterized protein n=1 Tax=Georgenia thermotolerans TaxID=527326 RepID=A0A7J5UJS6_9MICO|nr:hypothetical protein [Georgenia thermotolerans]KAE8762665.1 hypothetical protein GB883_18220 [Georgenia thermotolerans]
MLARRGLYAVAVAALAFVAMELHPLVTGTFQLWAVLLIAAVAVVAGRRLDPRRRRLRAARRAAESHS